MNEVPEGGRERSQRKVRKNVEVGEEGLEERKSGETEE